MRDYEDEFYPDDDLDEVVECVECGRICDGIYSRVYRDRSGNYLCGRCMN